MRGPFAPLDEATTNEKQCYTPLGLDPGYTWQDKIEGYHPELNVLDVFYDNGSVFIGDWHEKVKT